MAGYLCLSIAGSDMIYCRALFGHRILAFTKIADASTDGKSQELKHGIGIINTSSLAHRFPQIRSCKDSIPMLIYPFPRYVPAPRMKLSTVYENNRSLRLVPCRSCHQYFASFRFSNFLSLAPRPSTQAVQTRALIQSTSGLCHKRRTLAGEISVARWPLVVKFCLQAHPKISTSTSSSQDT